MGSTSENLATIELIGSKSDIQQATFMLGLPNDAPSVVRRNTLLLSRFLENIVPEWPSSDVWVAESTKKLVKRGEKISVIKDRKIIEIDFLQPLGIVVLSIREK